MRSRWTVGIAGVAATLLTAGILLLELEDPAPDASVNAPPGAQTSHPKAPLPLPVLRGVPREASRRSMRTLVVTVVSDDGTPVPNATVRITVRDRSESATTSSVARTDVHGRAEARAPARRRASWDAKAPGFGSSRGAIIPGQSRIDVVLERGGAITGVVTDSDGRPIPGIEVWTCDVLGMTSTLTDAQGRYVFPGMRPNYRAWIWAAEDGLVPGGTTFGTKVRVQSTRTHVVDLALVKGLTTCGRVVRYDGVPVPDARVWVATSSEHMVPPTYLARLETTTGPDGAFRIPDLPRNISPTSLEVYASAPGLPRGHAALGDRVIDFDQEPRRAEDPLEIVLQEPCFVDVRVVDETTGEGIPDTRLEQGSRTRTETIHTDADGRCRVGPLAPGRHFFAVRAEGWGVLHEYGGLWVEAVPGAVTEARYTMHRLFDITGRLVYEDGQLADDLGFGLAVRGEGYLMSTEISGTFHVRNLRAGTYEMVISARGMETATVDAGRDAILARSFLEAGTRDAVIILRGSRSVDLEILVRDASGAPLPAGHVVFRCENIEWTVYNVFGPLPLVEGRAVVTGVVHPLWIEVVPLPGSVWARARLRRIAPGTPLVEIDLTPGQVIHGRVVNEHGAPVPDAEVQLFPDVGDAENRLFGWDHTHGNARTNTDGTFAFDRLWRGDYRVTVKPPDAYLPVRNWKAAAGNRNVVVALRHRVDLALPVLNAAGLPLAGADVGIWTPPHFGDKRGIRACTDAEGIARLRGVDPEGVFCLQVRPPKDAGGSGVLWFEGWRPSEDPVRTPPAWVLEGTVRGADGRPAVVATVRLHHEGDAPPSTTMTEEGGRFRFVHLPLAPVVVRAVSADGKATSDLVSLDPPATDVRLRLCPRTGSLRVQILEWPPPPATREPWESDPTRFVVWDPTSPDDRRTGVPTAYGLVHVEGLDPTVSWSVLVTRSDRDLCARIDGIAADGEEHRVRARHCRPIRGRVVVPKGMWLTCVEVVESGLHHNVKNDGSYEIHGLPPGRWTLRALARRGRTVRYRTVVAAGETAPDLTFNVGTSPR